MVRPIMAARWAELTERQMALIHHRGDGFDPMPLDESNVAASREEFGRVVGVVAVQPDVIARVERVMPDEVSNLGQTALQTDKP